MVRFNPDRKKATLSSGWKNGKNIHLCEGMLKTLCINYNIDLWTAQGYFV
jgi:hypothetical protein